MMDTRSANYYSKEALTERLVDRNFRRYRLMQTEILRSLAEQRWDIIDVNVRSHDDLAFCLAWGSTIEWLEEWEKNVWPLWSEAA